MNTSFGFQVYGDESYFWFAAADDAECLRAVLVSGGKTCSRVIKVVSK